MCLAHVGCMADGWKPRILDVLGEMLSPTRCVCCERPGALLCDRCAVELMRIDPATACTRCGAPFGDLLCTECRGMPIALDHCLAATVFAGPPASMIRAFKDGGEMRLVDVLADLLTGALLDAERSASERFGHPLLCADAVTFVPATAEAFRRRGFDHMEMICSGVSDRVGLPMVDVLVKHGCSDQRGAGREERARLSRGVYEVVGSVQGLRVLVLDDVITTGATLNAVAAALRGAGAARVDGAAVARVWGQD